MLAGSTYSLNYEIYGPVYLKEELLKEGITDGLLKDGIQFLVSGAAEYGLGAVTLPAAGAGLAVGPTVETIVDSLFAAESIKSAIDMFNSVQSAFGEWKDIIQSAYEAYDMNNLEGYYDSLKGIVKKGFKELIPDDLADKFEEKVEQFKETLQGLMKKILDPIKSGLKLVIPDATISLAVAKFVQELLEKLAENAFSLFAEGIEKFEMLKDFLADPSVGVNFFKDVFQQLADLLNEAGDKIEDKSWTSSMLQFGAGGAVIVKKLGPAGLRKGSELLQSAAPTIVEMIDKILTLIIPMMITALALFQIVMKGDYLSDDDEEDAEDTEETAEDTAETTTESVRLGDQMALRESQLRKIIRHTIIIQSRNTR